jgi:hypothetical protein
MASKKRKARPFVADAATITLTADEARAILSGVGAALRHGDPPDAVAPHLATAIEKFDVAFGFQLVEGK